MALHHRHKGAAPHVGRHRSRPFSTARALACTVAWLLFVFVALSCAALLALSLAADDDPRAALTMAANDPRAALLAVAADDTSRTALVDTAPSTDAGHGRRLASCDRTDSQVLSGGQVMYYPCSSVTSNPYYAEVSATIEGFAELAMTVSDGPDCTWSPPRVLSPSRFYPEFSRRISRNGRFNSSAVFGNSPACWYLSCDVTVFGSCAFTITITEQTLANSIADKFREFLARPYGVAVVVCCGVGLVLPLVLVWCCKSCGKCEDCCECCDTYCALCIWVTEMVRKLIMYTFYCGLCCCFCCKDDFGMNCCDLSECECCEDSGAARASTKTTAPPSEDYSTTDDNSRECNACQAEIPTGSYLWSCEPCDYDMCTTCYTGIPDAARQRMHMHTLSFRQVAEHGLVAATPSLYGGSNMMANPLRAAV